MQIVLLIFRWLYSLSESEKRTCQQYFYKDNKTLKIIQGTEFLKIIFNGHGNETDF